MTEPKPDARPPMNRLQEQACLLVGRSLSHKGAAANGFGADPDELGTAWKRIAACTTAAEVQQVLADDPMPLPPHVARRRKRRQHKQIDLFRG
jgi:hypothetical protein